ECGLPTQQQVFAPLEPPASASSRDLRAKYAGHSLMEQTGGAVTSSAEKRGGVAHTHRDAAFDPANRPVPSVDGERYGVSLRQNWLGMPTDSERPRPLVHLDGARNQISK